MRCWLLFKITSCLLLVVNFVFIQFLAWIKVLLFYLWHYQYVYDMCVRVAAVSWYCLQWVGGVWTVGVNCFMGVTLWLLAIWSCAEWGNACAGHDPQLRMRKEGPYRGVMVVRDPMEMWLWATNGQDLIFDPMLSHIIPYPTTKSIIKFFEIDNFQCILPLHLRHPSIPLSCLDMLKVDWLRWCLSNLKNHCKRYHCPHERVTTGYAGYTGDTPTQFTCMNTCVHRENQQPAFRVVSAYVYHRRGVPVGVWHGVGMAFRQPFHGLACLKLEHPSVDMDLFFELCLLKREDDSFSTTRQTNQ